MYFCGLVPLYVESIKRHGRAEGVSTIFLVTDVLGALFSLMGLVAQNHFDLLGGISYSVILCMESGILAMHLCWLWRTRKVRADARQAGMAYDEFVNVGGKESASFATKGKELKRQPEQV